MFSAHPLCGSHENKPPQLMTHFQTLWLLTLLGIKEIFLMKKEKCDSLDTCRLSGENQKSTFWRDKDRKTALPWWRGRLAAAGGLTRTLFSVLSALISSLTLFLNDSFTFLPTASRTLSEHRRWERTDTLNFFGTVYGALLNIFYLQVIDHEYGLGELGGGSSQTWLGAVGEAGPPSSSMYPSIHDSHHY